MRLSRTPIFDNAHHLAGQAGARLALTLKSGHG
jgi:hypothetical protein